MIITALGGYQEVGRNSTLIEIDDEAVILDLGLHLENYLKLTEEEEETIEISSKRLIVADALPDIRRIENKREKVKAIIISHGHLDHYGGIVYLARFFPQARIIAPPFVIELIKKDFKDKKTNIKNRLIPLHLNSSYHLSPKIKIEFIYVTHSILQATIVVLETLEGNIVYANDFKLDPFPVLTGKTNLDKLEKIKPVKLLLIDSLYIDHEGKTPSESTAKQMLNDVILGSRFEGLIISSTFSSHLARINSLIELGERLKRKVILLGRSMDKYSWVGEKLRLVNFRRKVEIIPYRSEIKRKAVKIRKNKKGYFLIVTGHQGEPNSVLSRIARKEINFDLDEKDALIFSCRVIPSEVNIHNRHVLEATLETYKVRIFKDLHVSGHAYQDDSFQIISSVDPENLVPIHCQRDKSELFQKLLKQKFPAEKKVYIVNNGDKIVL